MSEVLIAEVDALARRMFKRVMVGAFRSYDDTISRDRVVYHIHEFPTATGEALTAIEELFAQEVASGNDVLVWRREPQWLPDRVDFEINTSIPAHLRLRFGVTSSSRLKRKHQLNFRKEDQSHGSTV